MLGKVTRNKAVFCKAGITEEITANALCIISLLTVTAVSLDRYLALQLHLRFNELVTIKRVVIGIGIIWVIGRFIWSLWLYKPVMVKIKVVIGVCLLNATFSYFQIYQIISPHYHNDVILKCALEQVNNRSGEHGKFRVLRSQCLLGLLFNCRMLLAIFLCGRRDNTDRTFSPKAVFSTK